MAESSIGVRETKKRLLIGENRMTTCFLCEEREGVRRPGDVPPCCHECLEILTAEGFVKEGVTQRSYDYGHGISPHFRNHRQNPLRGEKKTIDEEQPFCYFCGDTIEDAVIWNNKFGEAFCQRCRREVHGDDSEAEEVELIDLSVETFERFHSYPASRVDKIVVPRPRVLAFLGRHSAVAYESDKFTPGKQVKYMHEWSGGSKNGIVCFDPESETLITITPAKVTERGIEDAEEPEDEFEENPEDNPGAGQVALAVAPSVIEAVGPLYAEWLKRKR